MCRPGPSAFPSVTKLIFMKFSVEVIFKKWLVNMSFAKIGVGKSYVLYLNA